MRDHGQYVLLGEDPPREVALGMIGRFWAGETRWEEIDASEFAGFDRPGLARIACSLSFREFGPVRTLVSYETRMQATDDKAGRAFLRYWRVAGPLAGFVLGAQLKTIAKKGGGAHMSHPVTFDVDYPDRPLNRVSTAFRIFAVIPIAIVLCSIVGYSTGYSEGGGEAGTVVVTGTGLLAVPPFLMILFREKYPRWWFDWNLELLRFINRVGAYAALLDDRYPSTDEHQSVQLDFPYPDVPRDLNRWLPLVKWLLAIPHLIALAILYVGVFFVLIAAWFVILFSGRYPRRLFGFVVGVMRWHNRVVGYALILVTDAYPPFSLRP
jgi:hypothetical protein